MDQHPNPKRAQQLSEHYLTGPRLDWNHCCRYCRRPAYHGRFVGRMATTSLERHLGVNIRNADTARLDPSTFLRFPTHQQCHGATLLECHS